MNELFKVELTKDQRDMLLNGLRFVRSSVALECRFPKDEVEQDRQQKYQEISNLVNQLNKAAAVPTASQV